MESSMERDTMVTYIVLLLATLLYLKYNYNTEYRACILVMISRTNAHYTYTYLRIHFNAYARATILELSSFLFAS